MCDAPCGHSTKNPDTVTRHWPTCKNIHLQLQPARTSSKRTRNHEPEVISEGPASRKTRTAPQSPGEDLVISDTGSKENHKQKHDKFTNAYIISPSPAPTPRPLSPSCTILVSDDDNDVLTGPSSDELPESLEQSQQLVTSPKLSRYSIYVDRTVGGVVICLSCSKAVHLDHVRSHLVKGHSFKDVPNETEVGILLRELGALPTDDISFPAYLITPIVGLDVVDGFECQEDDCNYISISKRTRNEHFKTSHPQQHANNPGPSTLTIRVQALYGFRGDRVVLKVLRSPPQPPTNGRLAYEKYMQRVVSQKPADPPTYELPSEKRLQSHFLTFTQWGEALEGKDIGAVQALVKSPREQDRFYPILAGCRLYYQHIASKLPGISELFLRWINTTKS